MLVLLAVQAITLAAHQPASIFEGTPLEPILGGDPPSHDLGDSVLMYRAEQIAFQSGSINQLAARLNLERVLLRFPAVVFSLWLGGALWWVSRRLYNNAGGYVALGLYCTSPAILAASSRVNAEILAAWGLFGAIYTSIGVAHML